MLNKVRAAVQHGLIRALVLSVATLVVPVAGAFLLPEDRGDYEALLWLTALIPAFLLSYYRGWRGVATSLAAGMASLSVTYAITQTAGRNIPDLLFPVVVFYIGISLMVGWLAERLHGDVKREQVEGAAFSDPVTGLPNRKHAELHLEIEMSAAQRGRSLTTVVLDLDHFANYNARHGTIAGDEALRLVGDALKNSTRRMNLAARVGDDEFMCVLGGSDEDGALVFMSRLRDKLSGSAAELSLPTMSAGIASFRPGMKSGQELIDAAFEALRRAQKEGPGRVRVHGRELQVALGAEPVGAAHHRLAMPEGRGLGRKALVVVEEGPVRTLLARYLTDHGFKVAQVSNVIDGVQCLSIEYDLLVTDISLSEGVGAELVRAAKLRWPSIQVLGVAEVVEGPIAIDTLNVGVDRYVEKPLDLPKLRQHLTELLARRDRLVASVLDNRQLALEFQAEKNEAASALRRSEEEYRNVVESLQEIIFRVDESGAFSFLNWAWCAVTGHALDQSLGHLAVDFVQREDRRRFKSKLEALLDGDLEEAREELRLVSLDGNPCWVDLRARRAFAEDGSVNGATGTMDDVTRRKHAEEQLRRTEAASRALLAALPDQVFGLSRSGMVLTQEGVNGTEQRKYIGLSLEEILTPDVALEYRQALGRLFETREVQIYEYRLDSSAGPQQYEARLAVSGEDEAVAIVRNVSDRSRLEEQLRQSQKLEAIGRLAGGLAHDFNNLLTVVQGNAHLLLEEFGGHENAREFAQQINSAADRGADLVRQMLAFGRKQVLQLRTLELNAIVSSVQGLLPRLIGEDILIELKLDPDTGPVKADPGQVEQVLVNLAAFGKARLPNGGTLAISTRNAAAGKDYDPDVVNLEGKPLVLLTVEDNGPPLDEETRVHVFEPFFDATSSPPSGLGLATVYGIVTQSGGTILLNDAPTGGARFQIFLPRVEAV